MADEPERLDVPRAEAVDDHGRDVLQVGVVGRGYPRPHTRLAGKENRTGRGGGRGHHEAVLVLVVDNREIVTLPVSDRSRAMDVEDEHHLFAGLQIAGIVEEKLAAGLGLGGVAEVGKRARGHARLADAARRGGVSTRDAEIVTRRRRPGKTRQTDAAEPDERRLHSTVHEHLPISRTLPRVAAELTSVLPSCATCWIWARRLDIEARPPTLTGEKESHADNDPKRARGPEPGPRGRRVRGAGAVEPDRLASLSSAVPHRDSVRLVASRRPVPTGEQRVNLRPRRAAGDRRRRAAQSWRPDRPRFPLGQRPSGEVDRTHHAIRHRPRSRRCTAA